MKFFETASGKPSYCGVCGVLFIGLGHPLMTSTKDHSRHLYIDNQDNQSLCYLPTFEGNGVMPGYAGESFNPANLITHVLLFYCGCNHL